MKQILMLDTVELILSIQVITDLYGKDDDNPFYSTYMGLFSYVLANNGFIDRRIELPMKLFDFCKELASETENDQLFILRNDTSNNLIA
jgi:hypothetical protein